MSMVLRHVEVEGAIVDVRIDQGLITEIGTSLDDATRIVDGRGGALLPGLHDHHIHLLALAAAWESVDCTSSLTALAHAPVRDGWVRGFGTAHTPDRWALDELRPDTPVRVQHRSGALWMLNSAALREVAAVLDDSADVERDDRGEPTGRLFRYDSRLRPALPATMPDLDAVVSRLHRHGITGVTDATPDLGHDAVRALSRLPRLRVTLLGGSTGPRKLLLRDHDLPSFGTLADLVRATHAEGRPVAVHCVTAESLLLTLSVLHQVGSVSGDRIEHAAVVPPGVAQDIAQLGLAVVTQPSFLRLRGDDYLRDVDSDDVPFLYPYRSLIDAGVRVAASSDAPYGDVNPWKSMVDAQSRRSGSGTVMNRDERVSFATALAGYLSPPDDPGGPVRRLYVGAKADLCLLAAPLGETEPQVRAVVIDGDLRWQPGP